MDTLSHTCTRQTQLSLTGSFPFHRGGNRSLAGPEEVWRCSPLPQVSWPHLHLLALPNRGLTELSLIWELIRGIVQEQGGHFISSLLWALPALCSLHQPRPLAWALDIKPPVAAGNLPVRTFPFTTRLTGLGPSLPPICHHVSGCAQLLLGLNAALCQHQGVSAQARPSGTQESQAPSPFALADKVVGALGAKPTRWNAHLNKQDPEKNSFLPKGQEKTVPPSTESGLTCFYTPAMEATSKP